MSTVTRNVAHWALLPIVIFLGIAALFWKGLSSDPSTLPSSLINKPAPAFSLPPIAGLAAPGLSDQDLKRGRVTIVNIWASWCGPCRQEHPLLMQLAMRKDVALVGINNKDEPANAVRFLGALGQPFERIGADVTGRVTIDWGGYGVPETFIVDGRGLIRHKHVGPLTEAVLKGEIERAIEAAKITK